MLLSVHLDTYEIRVINYGEEGESTILAGARYAELLLKFANPRYADTALGCERRGGGIRSIVKDESNKCSGFWI